MESSREHEDWRKKQFWRAKHINVVAEIIAGESDDRVRRRLATRFAVNFAAGNKEFDLKRFLQACNVYGESEGKRG